MNVELLKDNPDGSAVFTFEMSADEVQSIIRYGIIAALKDAVLTAKEAYTPEDEQQEGENVEDC